MAKNRRGKKNSTPKAPPAAPEFKLFPTLPLELREMIWKFADAGPKIVTIYIKERGAEDALVTGNFLVAASYKIPEVLHTNREARRVAKGVIDYAFGKNLGNPVYFDWSRDALVFRTWGAMAHFYQLSCLDPSFNPNPLQGMPSLFDRISAGVPLERKLFVVGIFLAGFNNFSVAAFLRPDFSEVLGGPEHMIFAREGNGHRSRHSRLIKALKQFWDLDLGFLGDPADDADQRSYNLPELSSFTMKQLQKKLVNIHSQPNQSHRGPAPRTAIPGASNSVQKAPGKPATKRAKSFQRKRIRDQHNSDDLTSNSGPRNETVQDAAGPAVKGTCSKNGGGSNTNGGNTKRKAIDEENMCGGQEGDGDDDENAADTEDEDEFAIPPTKFKKFRKLPLEIRRMIWYLILPEPQVIKITGNGYLRHLTRGGITTQTWINRPRANYKVPYMLSICKESRKEVIVHHRPCFKANFGGIPIFFNAKQDLLHFQSTDALIHFYGGSLPNYVKEDLTNGFRYNMRDMHTVVEQIAIGRVRNMEGMIGGVLNQMSALRSAVIEDLNMRRDGANIIMDFTQGIEDLALGWKDYTVRRHPKRGVDFKLIDHPSFETLINQWNVGIPAFHKCNKRLKYVQGSIFADEELKPETEAVTSGGSGSSVDAGTGGAVGSGSGTTANQNAAAVTTATQATFQVPSQQPALRFPTPINPFPRHMNSSCRIPFGTANNDP
ncbi:hypothetical protein B2J93_3115 [Marssonina coronariae]|uniref:2EXR domain-containing protein n=1 Tax=Diplocarpon coronariae TaxID=2795749 RepID=A0A218Z2S4_9HELO|nr:hypothetical protein B2J93_3115 [Marssonina coronariae]